MVLTNEVVVGTGRRLDGVLSVLVKLSKCGGSGEWNWPSKAVACGDEGVLEQALDFASLHLALLLDATRVTTTTCRIHGTGGARGGYTNVYNRLSDKQVAGREIPNAYVALAGLPPPTPYMHAWWVVGCMDRCMYRQGKADVGFLTLCQRSRGRWE